MHLRFCGCSNYKRLKRAWVVRQLKLLTQIKRTLGCAKVRNAVQCRQQTLQIESIFSKNIHIFQNQSSIWVDTRKGSFYYQTYLLVALVLYLLRICALLTCFWDFNNTKCWHEITRDCTRTLDCNFDWSQRKKYFGDCLRSKGVSDASRPDFGRVSKHHL